MFAPDTLRDLCMFKITSSEFLIEKKNRLMLKSYTNVLKNILLNETIGEYTNMVFYINENETNLNEVTFYEYCCDLKWFFDWQKVSIMEAVKDIIIEVATSLFDTPWNMKKILNDTWINLMLNASQDMILILNKIRLGMRIMQDPSTLEETDGAISEDSDQEELMLNNYWTSCLLLEEGECDADGFTTSYPLQTMMSTLKLVSSLKSQSMTEQSSLSATTEKTDSTITTSSMTAPGAVGHAVAGSSKDYVLSLADEEDYNRVENLNQSISKMYQPREYHRALVGGTEFEIHRNDENLSNRENNGGGPEPMVEAPRERIGVPASIQPGAGPSDASNSRRRREVHQNGPRPYKNDQIEVILEFFRKYTPSPVLNALTMDQWLENNQLQYISRDDKTLQTAIDIFNRQCININITNFNTKFSETSVFSASTGDVSKYYLSFEDSVTKLRELLYHQLGDEYSNFLQLLRKWYDRNNGKHNTIFIHGPPNSCKTLFVNILLDLAICSGQICNFNKFSQFPLQNCLDKRILYWDEPNFEPASLETLKMLFTGDKCPANIKFKDHQIINKTPVIITANNDPFPRNAEFNCRMLRFYWKAYDLKNNHLKIYPLALLELFKQENIIDN